jgi:Holliday junction DNA helicase RuvA
MIGRLTGRILECTPGNVLVDVAGVGYALQIPLSTYYALSGRSDGSASLYVYTHVREDALQLFGFSSSRERETFERLIGISGVGPRMALAVLSGIGAEDLERAVLDGDRERLTRIPGIGRKTADRILLELHDRLSRELRKTGRRSSGVSTPVDPDRETPLRSDAVSALVNLGYARETAGRAVDASIADLDGEPALEAVLKDALQRLIR